MNLMNTKKTAAGDSTAAVLTALTAVIVFLNFYFAIYDMHFFELFYSFSIDSLSISNLSLNGDSLRSILSFMILLGGITYVSLFFVRVRNGSRPVVMILLPLLSFILYRFIFGNEIPGIALPLLTMAIQAVLGVIPTVLWMIVNWVLQQLPFPHGIYLILSVVTAIVLSIGTAFVFTRNVRYRKKKVVKTRKGKHRHSIIHKKVSSVTEHSVDTDTAQPSVEQSDTTKAVDAEVTPVDNRKTDNLPDRTSVPDSLYEKYGYDLSGHVSWNGSMQNGSCSVNLYLKSRLTPAHAYQISGTGWETSDSQESVIQLNLSVEAINGEDQYRAHGTIHHEQGAFALLELQLSGQTGSFYLVRGEIRDFSAAESGNRHLHLIFEDAQNTCCFYAEGSYDADGLHSIK